MFISERDGEITRFFGTVRELQRQSVFVPFAKHPHRRIGHNPEIQRFNQRLHGAERGAFQPERTGPGRGVPEKQRIHPDRQNRFGERLAQVEHQRGAVPVQPRLRRDELRILRIAEDGESRDLPAEVFGIENQGDRPPRQIDNLVPALTEDKFVADAVEQKPVFLQSNGTASAPVPEKFVPVEAIQRINRLVARQLQHRRRFHIDIKPEERQVGSRRAAGEIEGKAQNAARHIEDAVGVSSPGELELVRLHLPDHLELAAFGEVGFAHILKHLIIAVNQPQRHAPNRGTGRDTDFRSRTRRTEAPEQQRARQHDFGITRLRGIEREPDFSVLRGTGHFFAAARFRNDQSSAVDGNRRGRKDAACADRDEKGQLLQTIHGYLKRNLRTYQRINRNIPACSVNSSVRP